MNGIKIVGMGAYAPKCVLTNADMEKIVETDDEWIITRTGIRQRHISEGEPTWYMGAQAAKAAIEKAGIAVEEIGLIISATFTPDYFTPSTACLIQRELKISGCAAMDLSAACTGFIYALDTARRYLITEPEMKYALVVANESISRFLDFTDRTTCILFGDGAAAAVVERSDALYAGYLGADGSGAEHIFSKVDLPDSPFVKEETKDYNEAMKGEKHYFYQNGSEVYRFATRIMPSSIKKVCEKAGITPEELEWIVPHQANIRIIKSAMKSLKLPVEKAYVNIEKYGNTASASVPLALNEAIENGAVKRGDKICLVGMGAGLTFGAIVLEY